MRVNRDELHDLMRELADEAARSDIECLCHSTGVDHRTYMPHCRFDDPSDVAAVERALRYLAMREASGEPMPYKVIRDGDKVRFE